MSIMTSCQLLLLIPTIPFPPPLFILLPRQHRSKPLLHLLLSLLLALPIPRNPQPASNLPPHIRQRINIEIPQRGTPRHHRHADHIDRRDAQRLEGLRGAIDGGLVSSGRGVEGREGGAVFAREGAARYECGEGHESYAAEEEHGVFVGARAG